MKKFLVIQTAFIGDAILATALLEKLHKTFPDSRIDLLIRKGNESLFEGHPFLHDLIVWRKGAAKYPEMYRVIKKIRRTRYDHIVNIHRYASSGVFTRLAKAEEKIGYDKNPYSRKFDRIIEHRTDGVHEVERLEMLIAHLVEGGIERPKLYPLEKHEAEIKNLIEEPFVCMAPTSVWFTKQWPAEKWVELINALSSDINVYLLGGPGDRKACQAILDSCGRENVRNLSGELSLLASAALMKRADMNYVNDSAPLHLASAMNAPVRAIFCSTIPSFGFGPLSHDAKTIETDMDLECRPCGLHGKSSCPKDHFDCANSIDPQKVLAN